MEEVIDLRPYIQTLLRNTKWLISISFILAIATFFIIRLSPETYQATASVIIVGDNNLFQFDPRIQSVTDNEPVNALPELAKSNDVLLLLLEEEALATTEIETTDDLQKRLEATAGTDRSLLRLTARTSDPALSARLANRWAELVIDRINSIYGIQDSNQVFFFQEQLSQSKTTLETAESELIQFQEINRTAVISNTLAFYNQEQTLLLTEEQTLNRLLSDSQQMQSQLRSLPNSSSTISFSDQLTALNMQLEAYNTTSTTPVLIQVESATSLIGSTKNEQIAFIERMVELTQVKLNTVENRLTALEPEILALQQAWQEAVVENQRLERNRLIAEETFLSLARKVQEEQIIAQDDNSGLRLISQATIPTEAESKRTLLFTVLAGAVGFVLISFLILTKTWWQQTELT